MKFELLPNELIFETFEYLTAIDLFRGFYNLNSHFDKLLNTVCQSYHLDLRSISKQTFTTVYDRYLPSIINRVVSLYLADDDETPNLPAIFLSYKFTLNQFNHLKSLTLYGIRSHDILSNIIIQCHDLPNLIHLKLVQCLFNNDDSSLINTIWNLPKLIHCHMNDVMSKGSCFSRLSIKSSSIRYLSIEHIICDLRFLSYVFEYTPNLQQLRATLMDTEKNEHVQINAPFLTKLNLSYHGPITTMISLFEQLFNLQCLTLSISYLLINGHQWENILVHYLPNIKRFRFKMDFHFTQTTHIENRIDELLDTFQTDFWINKHRWFVRCDWNPSNPFNYAVIYTLPYAFSDFHFVDETLSKSTCPNGQHSWDYNHVKILEHENNVSNCYIYSRNRFPNISHLEIILPFNERFLSNIPTLEHLVSLDVTLLPGDVVYDQLQLLLNRAPRLHLLRFSHLSDLETTLFKIQNTSIRRLDFFTKESMLYSWYFNKEQCITLANSSLGRQCQTLVIDIKHRTNVNDLIMNMPNLQSLVFQCKDDKWSHKASSTIDDELIQWLNEHLPSTCSISRNQYQNSIIQVWIR